MRSKANTTKRIALAAALSASVLLGGCGSGVQLEGPGFKALGLTSDRNKKDAKVPDRAPLLIPPNRARLPEPQQSTASAPQEANWPDDPDARRKAEVADANQKQKDYEDKGNWDPKAGIDEFEKLSDPMARRKVGILDKWFKNSGGENVRGDESVD